MTVRKTIFVMLLVVAIGFVLTVKSRDTLKPAIDSEDRSLRVAEGKIKKGDTLLKLFRHNSVDPADVDHVQSAADGVYDLGRLCSGRPYKIAVDDEGRLDSLIYWVDDEKYLNVSREGDSLSAAMEKIEYENRLISLGGTIKDNLISSLGPGKDAFTLALDLSDIFAWDIDFNTDLRNGDTYKIIVEGHFLEDGFRRFGSIISAEFVNKGRTYTAYRFTKNGVIGYYDSSGMPLKKAFLKAPLNFRRISSYWTERRFHPILKRHRPHRGIDYVAPRGTPVSAVGSGCVHFAGYRAGYGNLVIIAHNHDRTTYYGHLSRIEKAIRQGKKVQQGDVIGNVGSTGLATGPHLHFEMRIKGKPVNPLAENNIPPDPVEARQGSEFRDLIRQMDERLEKTAIQDDSPLAAVLAATGSQGEGG